MLAKIKKMLKNCLKHFPKLRKALIQNRMLHRVRKSLQSRQTGKELFPNQRFCVIYRWHEHAGIFSHILAMLPALCWAEEKGFIPVIDWKDVPNVHKPEGDENWWELFFEQPGGYTLGDLENTKNIKVIDSAKMLTDSWKQMFNELSFLRDTELLNKLRRVFRNNIRLNQETMLHIERVWENMLGGQNLSDERGKGFLGVRIRGSDYDALGEGVPWKQDIIKIVKTALKETTMSRIFLATDDVDVVSLFEKAFDKSVLHYIKEDDRINEADVWEMTKQGIDAMEARPYVVMKRTTDKYLHNLNYITEIMLLTKCDGIIWQQSSAGMLLPLMKDDWKYELYL